MATPTKTVVITCAKEGCTNTFVPKNAQHGFCSTRCRRSARGAGWRFVREAALLRDNDTCQDCHETDCKLEVHHRVPLCKGGDNRLYNLTTLCKSCHRSKHRTWKLSISWEVLDALRPQQNRGGYHAA
ncbi:MAG TPA: HNH endonuclease [Chloroflexia bacterium]|nr:HNH endonuclease [Chloroflexia bacterium]